MSMDWNQQIIDCVLERSLAECLGITEFQIPHQALFNKIRAEDDANRKRSDPGKGILDHIQSVIEAMNNLFDGKFDKILDESISKRNVEYRTLKKIVESLEKRKYFLLYAALFHDIGKSIIKPRHGLEGADIIKDSGIGERQQFYNLGFNRSDFFLMSDLIRYHDYLAMVGTGKVSYQIFSEVLNPISNISLSKHPDTFLDLLLLLNISDIVGSIGRLDLEDFTTLMYDFRVIKRAHESIAKKLNNSLLNPDSTKSIEEMHKETISFRTLAEVICELQRLTENHTAERLRRLLRNSFKASIQIPAFTEYEKSIKDGKDLKDQFIDLDASQWFIRLDDVIDIVPIVVCLRGINVKRDF